jgi:hypothetical protein
MTKSLHKSFHILFSFLIYIIAAQYFGFNGLNPSDPLEYIIPAYNELKIFPYLDRMLLGAGIKLFSKFIENPVILSYAFPICINFLIHWISALYILKISNYKNLYIFVMLIIASPFNIATFSYIYPSTLMLLFLLVGVNFINERSNGFMAGITLAFAMLSKIQGMSYAINIILKFNLRWYLKAAVGFGFGLLIIYLITVIIFNDQDYVLKIFNYYFENNARGQFAGYGGVMPPFEMYIFEPFILFLALVIYCNKEKINELEKNILSIALSQILILVLIYYVTRRGGQLIPNYISPGIYLITLVAAMKLPVKNLFSVVYIAYFIIIYLIGIYYVEMQGGVQYFATSNYIIELLSSGIIFLVYVYKEKLKNKNYWIIFGMIVIPFFSYKAQSENHSRVKWSKPFTNIYEMSRQKRYIVNYKFSEQNSYERRFQMMSDLDAKNKFQNCKAGCEYTPNFITDSEIEAYQYFHNSVKTYKINCKVSAIEKTFNCGNTNSSDLVAVFPKDSGIIRITPNLVKQDKALIAKINYVSSSNVESLFFVKKILNDSSSLEVALPNSVEEVSIEYMKLLHVDLYGDLFVISNE